TANKVNKINKLRFIVWLEPLGRGFESLSLRHIIRLCPSLSLKTNTYESREKSKPSFSAFLGHFQ
ncbi:MAG: hypothetical protein AAFZ92_10195, partial [Pseudomonadota bacterium]